MKRPSHGVTSGLPGSFDQWIQQHPFDPTGLTT
jgi:hypothetical protein